MLSWKFKKGINAEDQPGYRQKEKALQISRVGDQRDGEPSRKRGEN